MAVSPTVRIKRLGYRAAYRLLMLSWFLRRPQTRGVKCLLGDGDRVLLVRHTYGPDRWDVPGGGMHRHEPPEQTARREMAEELGLELDWRPIGRLQAHVDYRADTLHCFSYELADPPLRVDPVEIAAARWFPRSDLPTPRARHVEAIIALAGQPEA